MKHKTPKQWLIDRYQWMDKTWNKCGANDDWMATQIEEYASEEMVNFAKWLVDGDDRFDQSIMSDTVAEYLKEKE